ncbi:hypothetical protein MNBD_PLANCTO03-1993, partial [hydrothermal vent metagenome]
MPTPTAQPHKTRPACNALPHAVVLCLFFLLLAS